jgi:hypothetical protein
MILLGLLTTACEVRTWLDLTFADATSGSLSLQVGFDDELRQTLERFGQGRDLTAEIREQAEADGWTVTELNDGAIEGVILTHSFADLDQLRGLLSAPLAEGGDAFSGVSINETDETVRVEAEIPSIGLDFPDLVTIDGRIRATFAGEVIEHNGTLEGNTVTWSFADLSGGGETLFAEARKPAGFPWLIVLVAVLVTAIGATVWYRLAGGRRPTEHLPTP